MQRLPASLHMLLKGKYRPVHSVWKSQEVTVTLKQVYDQSPHILQLFLSYIIVYVGRKSQQWIKLSLQG